MSYQIKGIVKYFKMVQKKKINFPVILRINLRSKVSSFSQTNQEISIFAWQKPQYQRDTVVYLVFFSSDSNLS